MIQARPGFFVHFEPHPTNEFYAKPADVPIEAWSSDGEPLLAGRQGLVPLSDYAADHFRGRDFFVVSPEGHSTAF